MASALDTRHPTHTEDGKMTSRTGILGLVVGGALSLLAGTPASAEMLAPGSVISGDFVLAPTAPGKWGPPADGTGASVTWSVMPSMIGGCAAETAGCTIFALSTFMPAGFLTPITNAFAAWSAIANITFTQVADCGAVFNAACAGGDIRIGGHVFDGAGGTLAHGFFPPVNGVSAAGDIHFDIAETWDLSFAGAGFDIFQVMAHEIGHAIGLDHTGVAASLMNPFYSEAFSGPQADDIAGALFIYGAPVVATPEPGMLALFGFGLAALGFARRRGN